MGNRQGEIPGGLLIPERCQFDALSVNDGSATGSDYSEANPRPGLPVVNDADSQVRLELSGEQGVDVDVRVVKSGNPGREGLQLAVREDGDATWLTWDSFSVCTGMTPIDWGTADTEVHDIATVPSTQAVIVARQDGTDIKLTVIEADGTVTDQTTAIALGADWNFPALVVLPGSERIVCFYGGAAHFTDDLGVTWTVLSDSITDESTTNYGPTSAVVYRGDIVLFVEDTLTAETIHHLVSTDGGATFQLVQSTTALGVRVDAVANEDGIHVVWVDQSTATEYRRLGTAFEPLDAVTQTAISSGAGLQEITIWADSTGSLYVLHTGTGLDRQGFVHVSYDTGDTWLAFKAQLFQPGDSNDSHRKMRATYASGRAYIVTGTHTGAGFIGNRPMVLEFGGWYDLQFSIIDNTVPRQKPEERWGFATHDRSAVEQGATLFAWQVPNLQGWTTTATGTVTVSDTFEAIRHSTAAETAFHELDLGTNVTYMVSRARLDIPAGGSTTTQDIAITARAADASSFEYEAEILFDLSGGMITITVNDINSAATATATFTNVTFFDVKWALNTVDEEIVVYHKLFDDNNYTALAAVSLTDAGATANNSRLQWAHIAVGTATSDWREFHYATASGTNVPVLYRAVVNRFSRSFNSRPEPIPTLGTTTGSTFLAAVSGPARRGETIDIDAHHDHPIEHVHAELFPGLDTTWRSTDTTEQIIAYDLGDDSWVGHSLGLFVAKANFRKAFLESYNGATWDTEATLDLAEGFTDLRYSLTGDTMHPDTATTDDAGRWLWEQEKLDGLIICTNTIDLPPSSTNAATRILSQSTGGWSQTKTAIPMLRLEDVSVIGGFANELTAAICSPSGLVVAHQTAVKIRQFWRVRIPAGTAGDDTPEGESFYEAAIIALCRVQSFGAQIGWSNSDQAEPNIRTREDERGTVRAREMGVERRRWVLGGWSDAPTNLGQNVRLNIGANYVGSSEANALALAGFEDVFHHLRGLLRVIEGGALPVIAVEPIPFTSDQTLTDPSRILYGRLSSAVRARRHVGNHDDTEGQGEVLRVDDITVTELV